MIFVFQLTNQVEISRNRSKWRNVSYMNQIEAIIAYEQGELSSKRMYQTFSRTFRFRIDLGI